MEGETLEETLNRVIIDYNHKNNSNPSNWIYAKYGNLVKHILTRLNLDATAILRNMSQNMIPLIGIVYKQRTSGSFGTVILSTILCF